MQCTPKQLDGEKIAGSACMAAAKGKTVSEDEAQISASISSYWLELDQAPAWELLEHPVAHRRYPGTSGI